MSEDTRECKCDMESWVFLPGGVLQPICSEFKPVDAGLPWCAHCFHEQECHVPEEAREPFFDGDEDER